MTFDETRGTVYFSLGKLAFATRAHVRYVPLFNQREQRVQFARDVRTHIHTGSDGTISQSENNSIVRTSTVSKTRKIPTKFSRGKSLEPTPPIWRDLVKSSLI